MHGYTQQILRSLYSASNSCFTRTLVSRGETSPPCIPCTQLLYIFLIRFSVRVVIAPTCRSLDGCPRLPICHTLISSHIIDSHSPFSVNRTSTSFDPMMYHLCQVLLYTLVGLLPIPSSSPGPLTTGFFSSHACLVHNPEALPVVHISRLTDVHTSLTSSMP